METYNKPTAQYREETFAILALNAWELLLKARLLALSDNDPRVLHVYEYRQLQTGTTSKKRTIKLNRTGNAYSIGIGPTIDKLDTASSPVPNIVLANLNILTEIRDNAIHYINSAPTLEKIVTEVAAASILNFVELTERWFGGCSAIDAFHLLPIEFISPPTGPRGYTSTAGEKNIVRYVNQLIEATTQDSLGSERLQVALYVDIKLRRSAGAAFGPSVTIVHNDPSAQRVVMAEDDMVAQYPWDYKQLVIKLAQRFSDFKQNQIFHQLRRKIVDEQPSLVWRRPYDPQEPRGAARDYYSPNIVRNFDSHYSVRIRDT